MPFISTPKIDDNYFKQQEQYRPCTSSEHNPPSMMVYTPGEYEYQCPACGHITRFVVHGYTL